MSISKEFVLAGKAIFTIEVPEAYQGNHKPHYTFKIEVVEANDRWPKAIFVKLFVGTENHNYLHYKYLGKLNEVAGRVYATQKSCRDEDSYEFRLLNKILACIWGNDSQAFEQYGFKVHHEGRCGRCGKLLTVPESIENGIGPECARKMVGV